MEIAQFERMVARLEAESQRSLGVYQLKVGLLALLGFAILALILGFAGLALLLIGGLLVAAVLTGGKAIIVLFKLGKLLVLLAIPLWLLLKSSLSALFTRFPPPQGRELSAAQAPALYAALADMRQRMRGPRFHHVLITDDLNAAVVQRPLFGLFGWPRNYLLLGLPLLESLSPQEALAVVAHEYGHLAGSHGSFGAFIYRLRNTWGSIQALSEQWQGFGGRWLGRLVGWYAPYFNAYTFVLARAQEYQADAASAELVGAATAVSALKRVNVSAAAYDRFLEDTFAAARREPTPPADLAEQWAHRAVMPPPAEHAQQWLQRALDREGRAMDTHPVLRKRIVALGDRDSQAAPALPAPLAGASAAQVWLGSEAGRLRQAFQRQWHAEVVERWRQHHDQWQAKRARLDELQALAEPGVDERIETLQLRLQLEPQDDHLPALVAFNAQHADHALGLYLEGCVRLDQGDAEGLALLERTMALDADATKPACEKAFAFLRERRDERAGSFEQRWNERHRWEIERHAQLEQLSPHHELRAPGLPEDAQATALALVRQHGKGVSRAWLVRRVLPADDSVMTYVLCLELTGWARWRNHQADIVDRLARETWPMHVILCTLDGQPEDFQARVQAVPGAELQLA
ncbi:M48 family metalloprotease [Aquabacterium sp. A7-Y]|uniref:M48 family metallopeptidase n=1 Tax=Aquabacterium sp. A7-Y TaxID=1349605 RepID=UPI00223E7F8B|nr:M48 family metallopeptidase [Aquabacterium sp. A7-Y]MCW7538045.1 M48 family metalloprotease [Aquabacterium sp. A7-Y]